MFRSFSLGLAAGRCAKARRTECLKYSKVFLWIIFDEGKSRGLLDPNIYLVKADDRESSLERYE